MFLIGLWYYRFQTEHKHFHLSTRRYELLILDNAITSFDCDELLFYCTALFFRNTNLIEHVRCNTVIQISQSRMNMQYACKNDIIFLSLCLNIPSLTIYSILYQNISANCMSTSISFRHFSLKTSIFFVRRHCAFCSI